MMPIFIILVLSGYVLSALLFARNKLWEIRNTLEYWISIDIADDIYRAKDNRPEFQYYVNKIQSGPHNQELIPKLALNMIDDDLKYLNRPIYYSILWLMVTRKIK